MTCAVCALLPERRLVLERLMRDGKSVEEVGSSFRIDYDVITEHMDSHIKEHSDSYITRVSDMLNELQDMVEVARVSAEKEESDAANITAYGNMVKLFHSIAVDLYEREAREREAQIKSDALVSNVTDKVLNPMLTDVLKTIVSELARLRDEVRKSGADMDIVGRQFDETTRRLGTQLQGVVDPYQDVLRAVTSGKVEKKKKAS